MIGINFVTFCHILTMSRSPYKESLLSGVVFIDLIKAFDTTDHKIISRKMSLLGVNQAAMRGSCGT